MLFVGFFFFQAEDGIRDVAVTGVQTCALPIYWAFKPPVKPAVAKVKDGKWTQNEIDKFILARLEKEKLKPSPEAEKVTLLRRLSLDLIGLPPTPQEVDAFLTDKSKDAYARQIERLLAS